MIKSSVLGGGVMGSGLWGAWLVFGWLFWLGLLRGGAGGGGGLLFRLGFWLDFRVYCTWTF